MPTTVQAIKRTQQASGTAPAALADLRASVRRGHRSALFFVADLIFLVAAGIVATAVMHVIHQMSWSFVLMSLCGMLGAMLAQMLLAFIVSPLLGSIESMVPSMIVGMTSPMTICVLHLFGCESSWPMAATIGAAFGVSMFIFVQAYKRRCQRNMAGGGMGLRG